ncbi:MAG: sodium-dependent bicarbonate transport family permease [Burkholderiaceae bacterium]
MNPIDIVPLFFLLGVAARLFRSDLKLPSALYETLSIFCLLSIGLKGGAELAQQPLLDVLPVALSVMLMGVILPLLAFPILKLRFDHANAAAIAAHYGSVSVVTFAIASAYLTHRHIDIDPIMSLALVLLESPGVLVGVLLAKLGNRRGSTVRVGELLHEVLSGKSIVLLMGGLIIGFVAGPEGLSPVKGLFFDMFKGALCLFLLEMGLVAGGRLRELRQAGLFVVAFGIIWPCFAALIGLVFAHYLGFDLGDTVILMTMAASASYIAAPAAMRIAVPEANPAFSIGASLGVTFPFNIMVGIPLYHAIAVYAQGAGFL